MNFYGVFWKSLLNVAKQNVPFSMDTVEQLVLKTCNSITEENWFSKNVITAKNRRCLPQTLIPNDTNTEELIINLGENSDSYSDNDSDKSSVSDLSGIIVLNCDLFWNNYLKLSSLQT